jgi:alpha-beta hydrolase superfamily lysophospholipase
LIRELTIAVCVAALSACATPQQVPPGPGPAQAHFADDSHWIAGDGYRLAFSSWQAAKPRAIIVALHGMNDYGEAFAMPAKFWSENGVSTYAFDQRGFGRTEGDGRWPGTPIMVADARAFVALLRGRHPGLPIFLMGESMGGAVAILAGGESAGADGIILVSPALLGWSQLSVGERTALWTMMQISPGSQVTGQGLNRQPSDNIPVLEALGRDPYVIKRTRVDAVYGLVNLMEEASQRAGEVKPPTLIVYAGDDQVVPSQPIEELLQRMHNARALCYSDGFHMLLRDVKGARAWKEILDYITTPADRAAGEARACEAATR